MLLLNGNVETNDLFFPVFSGFFSPGLTSQRCKHQDADVSGPQKALLCESLPRRRDYKRAAVNGNDNTATLCVLDNPAVHFLLFVSV